MDSPEMKMAKQEMRRLLSMTWNREALKALLTEDAPVAAAYRTYHEIYGNDEWKAIARTLAAAVDALDSPEGDT